jgi:hypothetical protein
MLQVKRIHAAVTLLLCTDIELKMGALLDRIFQIFVAVKNKSAA